MLEKIGSTVNSRGIHLGRLRVPSQTRSYCFQGERAFEMILPVELFESARTLTARDDC